MPLHHHTVRTIRGYGHLDIWSYGHMACGHVRKRNWILTRRAREVGRLLLQSIGTDTNFITTNNYYYKEVPNRTQHVPYTIQLLKKQLMLYGRIGRAPNDDALRSLTFCPGSLTPATSRFVRRVGRPRHEWTSQLNAVAVDIARGMDKLESLIGETAAWKDTVDNYYKN